MRCLSCGFMNSAHALECARCKQVIDPIAAAATVNVAPQPNGEAVMTTAPVFPSMPRPPAPPPPAQTSGPAPALTPFKLEPQRRNLASADLEFLVDQVGANRSIGPMATPPSFSAGLSGVLECSVCHRQLPADLVMIAQNRGSKPLCVDCQAKQAHQEEAKAVMRDRLRLVGGFIGAAVAGAVCLFIFPALMVNGASRQLSLVWLIAVGAIVGLGARLGALNKPSMVLQIISLVVGALSVMICLDSALSNLYGGSVGLTDTFSILKPGPMEYLWLGLAVVAALVVPSGVLGGNDESLSASQ